MARTGPAQGSTHRNKNLHEGGGMRNQRPKATTLANSRKKKKRQVARLTLMHKCVTNQAAIDIPCYVQHKSFLKTRASHPLKFIPLQPSWDTYKYSFWPRTIIDWNSLPSDYLTMNSTAKFKATISDYIFLVWGLPLSIIVFSFLYFLVVVL